MCGHWLSSSSSSSSSSRLVCHLEGHRVELGRLERWRATHTCRRVVICVGGLWVNWASAGSAWNEEHVA